MVKLLVFAILLASSPATGFLETLFRVESSCYNGCHANFGDNPANAARLAACREGCDYKLHDEDCAKQCKLYSSDERNQASCQVGCTLSGSEANIMKPPMIAVDPVPEVKEPETVPSNPEPERPRSIILIRLRQRPSGEMPSMENVFGSDPFQMFNDMIRRFQEKAQSLEQNIRTSIDEKVKDAPQLPTFETINNLVKVIPLNPKPSEAREDSSSSESSEENQGKQPLLKEIEHVLQHPREQQQIIRERLEPVSNRLQQIASNLRNEWSNLVQNQPRFPVWIFLCILLSSSVILWYMLMSLCRHTPAYAPLSVRAQELVFHPYEYEGYEKEKIQPDGEIYEVTEALPIKVKLSNI